MASEPEVIHQQMAATRARLTERFDQLESKIRGDIDDVTAKVSSTINDVADTVNSVRESTQETIESVKRACDLHHHVEKRPWLMVLGAAALGYVGTNMLNGDNHTSPRRTPSAISNGKNAFQKLGETFEPEIGLIKGLAIGALFGLIRDAALKTLPRHLEQPVDIVLNGVSMRCGGRPMPGRSANAGTGRATS